MSILEAKEAGNNLLKEGQLEEAIAEYSKAIEQCGGHFRISEHAGPFAGSSQLLGIMFLRRP